MSENVRAFESWIRGPFREMNTELEELYWGLENRAAVEDVGDDVKQQLLEEGRVLVRALQEEGNTDEGFDRAVDLLGDLGLYMAALRRHELTNPERERRSPHDEASALGMHIGASVGMVPRFATSHLTTHNVAVDGMPKSFTSLPDEHLFIELNASGIFAYMRCAEALRSAAPLGISHPVSEELFRAAERALDDVGATDDRLDTELDQERFFWSIRPYYKPYRVGRTEYRGANAGDFAGINEIDLLLGLCAGNDPYYSQLLVEKFLFMRPEEQASLRDCLRRRSFLDEFLDALPHARDSTWFQRNCRAFLDVVAAHGRTATKHHDRLVLRFVEQPSTSSTRRTSRR